ncbi:endo alpha-1,4 polygalactosaminidase [Flavobacterium gelatinilyticum]|uniref:endo alpha-1,4 polygalactosaminidase n=1 Tax=Flavobacterium gelatinilyticum TaxID=3003260 RepID=UPI0024815527|nr:endo alpha-1,4 polygalactosaminidase [Flavobacterium gelatinilyticum]
MKIRLFLLLVSMLTLSCSKDNDDQNSNQDQDNETEYKERMREFVIGISKFAKSQNAQFIVIPQNGIEIVSANGDASGENHSAYLNAIDGNGQEDLFFGYNDDDQATPAADNQYLRELLDKSKNTGKTILVTDYCSTPSKVTSSYTQNKNAGYISFAADKRDLTSIPGFPSTIPDENATVVKKLSEIKNFLYLINPSGFSTKTAFINAVTATNYDLIIMDLYFSDGSSFTADEINQLRNKVNGGKRLVISYMSIGEAEDYRYYWQTGWASNKPAWLDAENPAWKGNYKVKYWNKDWQNIIFGNSGSYTQKVINAGFDGVYLDIIDAFEFYE